MEVSITIASGYISEMMDIFGDIVSALSPALELLFGLWLAFYIVNKIIRWVKMI
jgi:hypothetical protein